MRELAAGFEPAPLEIAAVRALHDGDLDLADAEALLQAMALHTLDISSEFNMVIPHPADIWGP